MIYMFLLTSFILLSIIYLIWKRKAPNRIPGPPGIPLFGNLFQMDYEKMYLNLDALSRTYGDIFQLNIAGQKLVCLNSSTVIRDVFLREPNATATSARPSSFIGKYIHDNNSDIGFTSPSKLMTKRRKLVVKLIHAYGEGLSQIEKEITKNLQIMIAEMKALKGRPVCPEATVTEFLMNIIETMIIGRSFGKNGELQKLIMKLEKNYNAVTNMGSDILYSIFPFLRFLPLRHSVLVKDFQKKKWELIALLSKIAKENPSYHGVFQGLMEETKSKDKDGKQWLTEENVCGALINIIDAGYVTSRGTLLSVIHILAKRTDLQKSLQSEIDTQIGQDREANLKDRENCPLVMAVLFETLRYISHIPMSLFHAAGETCVIQGHVIEKGTIIIPNLWTAHHSKKDWIRPYEFLPERFLDEEGQLVSATDPVRLRFQAFGCGKRSCIGEVFALSRLFLFLSTLMQNFTIEEPDDECLKEFTLDDLKPGLVLQPKQYKVKFVERK